MGKTMDPGERPSQLVELGTEKRFGEEQKSVKTTVKAYQKRDRQLSQEKPASYRSGPTGEKNSQNNSGLTGQKKRKRGHRQAGSTSRGWERKKQQETSSSRKKGGSPIFQPEEEKRDERKPSKLGKKKKEKSKIVFKEEGSRKSTGVKKKNAGNLKQKMKDKYRIHKIGLTQDKKNRASS